MYPDTHSSLSRAITGAKGVVLMRMSRFGMWDGHGRTRTGSEHRSPHHSLCLGQLQGTKVPPGQALGWAQRGLLTHPKPSVSFDLLLVTPTFTPQRAMSHKAVTQEGEDAAGIRTCSWSHPNR